MDNELQVLKISKNSLSFQDIYYQFLINIEQ